MVIVANQVQDAVCKEVEKLIERAVSSLLGLASKCGPGHHDIPQIFDHTRRRNKIRRGNRPTLFSLTSFPELFIRRIDQRLFHERKRKHISRLILLAILQI